MHITNLILLPHIYSDTRIFQSSSHSKYCTSLTIQLVPVKSKTSTTIHEALTLQQFTSTSTLVSKASSSIVFPLCNVHLSPLKQGLLRIDMPNNNPNRKTCERHSEIYFLFDEIVYRLL